jgi:hypothetical protein
LSERTTECEGSLDNRLDATKVEPNAPTKRCPSILTIRKTLVPLCLKLVIANGSLFQRPMPTQK